MTDIEFLDLVEYEILGSWWASWIPLGHDAIVRFMVWKTRRKVARMESFRAKMKAS